MRQSPQIGYLLRALVLLIITLTVWWVSLDPILGTLRLSTELAIRAMFPFSAAAEITVLPGGWHIKTPVPEAIGRRDDIQRNVFGRKSPKDPIVKVRSLQLDILPRHATLFTVSLPFFWAMTLAAPWTWGMLRGTAGIMAIGTAALGFIAVASMVFDVAYTFVHATHMVLSTFAASLFDSGNYLSMNVVPYLAPLVAAVALNASLRALIFSFQPDSEPAPARHSNVPVAKPPRKGTARVR